MNQSERHDRRRHRRRAVGAVAFAIAAVLIGAAAASAGGSTSIAAAPLIESGVSQTGNTITDATRPGDDGIGQLSGCWHDLEYWRVSLTAGDDVVIKGGATDSGENLLVAVFRPGTTAANIAKATAVRYGLPLNKALEFTAPSTGVYPVAAGPNCYNGADGPFAFTFTVTHGAAPGAVAVLPKSATIPASGTITATVQAGGSPISDLSLVLELSHSRGTMRPSFASSLSLRR